MARRGRGEDEMAAMGNFNLEASLTQLTKHNAKLERMLGKIGTLADTLEFRDLLSSERATATKLHIASLNYMKENKTKGPTVGRFEKEYIKFAEVIKKIDLKQKQQIAAMSLREHNKYADQIKQEEHEDAQQGGVPSSFAQEQLQNIEFLEYKQDEIATRHGQIKAIEKDIKEVAEMYKDLQTMVDEQQVHIDIIDANITETKVKVEKGAKELELAAEYQAKARKKACYSMIIIIVIILIILLIVFGSRGKL